MDLRFILVLCLAGFCYGQTCKKVYNSATQCIQDGPFNIECPNNHRIMVNRAEYRETLAASSCPVTENTPNCVAEDLYQAIKTQCHGKVNCAIITTAQPSRCGNGIHFVHIDYKCEPIHNMNGSARAIAICHSYSWTGSLIHIDSHPLGLIGNYISSSDCHCTVTVPADTQLMVRPTVFLKRPQPAPAAICNQYVELYNDAGESYRLCSQDNQTLDIPCQDREKQYSMRYVTDSNNTQVVFTIPMSVSHRSHITAECGYPTTSTSTTTTTVPPTTTTTVPVTTTTTEAWLEEAAFTGKSWADNNLLAIIVGAVCAAFLILAIFIILVLIRYRRDKERNREDSRSVDENSDTNSSKFTFVTGVYVDGDQKSKLVVDRKTNRPQFPKF